MKFNITDSNKDSDQSSSTETTANNITDSNKDSGQCSSTETTANNLTNKQIVRSVDFSTSDPIETSTDCSTTDPTQSDSTCFSCDPVVILTKDSTCDQFESNLNYSTSSASDLTTEQTQVVSDHIDAKMPGLINNITVDVTPTKDGSVLKEIKIVGMGTECPLIGDKVTIHCSAVPLNEAEEFCRDTETKEKYEFIQFVLGNEGLCHFFNIFIVYVMSLVVFSVPLKNI